MSCEQAVAYDDEAAPKASVNSDAAIADDEQPKPRGDEARARPARTWAPPAVPKEYHAFSDKIVVVHADHVSAAEAFNEIFARARFDAAFPEAAGLPMPIGLDLEWKPDRTEGSDNPIALVQLACWDTVLLARTIGCKDMPPWLAHCLEDPKWIKVTGSFDLADRAKLLKSFNWDFGARVSDPSSFLDVAELAKDRNVPHGLKKMAAEFELTMLKPKEIGCSNWAKEGDLSVAQKQYAAEDAFFTLYLLGFLFQHTPPAADTLASASFAAWNAMHRHMARFLKLKDNSKYREQFFGLREVVKDEICSLCTALGSGGSTSVESLGNVKRVQLALKAAQKECDIFVNGSFLKMNTDLFVVFWDSEANTLKVRPRHPQDEADDYDEEAEEEHDFVSRVLELLVAYKPPAEKRQSVINRSVPEAFWVPARAILSKREQARLLDCAPRYRVSFESASTEADGIILRLLRHPRAADSEAHLRACSSKLKETLGPDAAAAEAERRLQGDEKFVHFFSQLRLLERSSVEETAVQRSLRARVRILSDAHSLGQRLQVPWENVKVAIEKVKWYRQLLGNVLGASEEKGVREEEEAELQACLTAIGDAWPDVDKVIAPKRGKKRGAQGTGDGQDSKRQRGGKEKQKGRAS